MPTDHHATAAPAAEFRAARDLLSNLREQQVAAAQRFRWPALKAFNWALDHFDRVPDGENRPALQIVSDGAPPQRYTFGQLSRRSNQVANHLRALGVRRGDRILMILGNEVALWETMLGAFKLGAVVIPATEMLTPEDIRDRLERAEVRHVVVGATQVGKFADLPGGFTRICTGPAPDGWFAHEVAHQLPDRFVPDGPTAATDPLLLYFTSGTTSRPKLVLHTHQSYPVGHLSTMYWLGLRAGDVHLNISSPGWAKHAWSCFFAPWNAEACVFIHNTSRFQAKKLLDILAAHGITSLCAPPTVWRLLIQEDLAAYRGKLRLREVIGAGEPLNPEVIAQVEQAWGLTLRDGYGQTETTAQIGNAPGQPVKAGSMGRVLPGYRVVLLDPDGREADEGEVCLPLADRPLGLMAGYLGDQARTDAAMGDGHYHTGDIATRDADGYFTFVGRTDDVFKASDYRISPFELESALIEHPAVIEAAVVPSPDPLRLAVPKAFLVLAEGVPMDDGVARDILRFCRDRLAPYKRVRRIEFVAAMPKTISGKIRRVALRQQEQERRAGGERGAHEYFEDLLQGE